MTETKYKGKNIRVTEDAHKAAVEHCGTKWVVGAWVSEAIHEKLERENSDPKTHKNFRDYETK